MDDYRAKMNGDFNQTFTKDLPLEEAANWCVRAEYANYKLGEEKTSPVPPFTEITISQHKIDLSKEDTI